MAHADLEDDLIRVDTTWNEKELIKQIPGSRWGPAIGRSQAWYVPLAWASCVMLRGIFKQTLTIGEELNKWAFTERERRVDPAIELRLRTRLDWTNDTDPPVAGLYEFQRVGASFLNVAGDCLLGDEMGTGKTVQTLAAMTTVDSLPALVISPNSVKKNWEKEVRQWYPEATPIVITGTAAQRVKLIAQAARTPSAIAIVNIEAVRSLSRLAPYGNTRLKRCRECDKVNGEAGLKPIGCQVHPKPLNQVAWKTVIVDEAHRIKDPQSQQTRACWALMHQPSVTRRWALTGTPLANHPGDLWSIMHGVAPLDFPTKSKFIDRYALTGWNAYGGLDIVGLHPETRDEFYRIFDPRFRRMPKALVLDQLPPKIRQPRYVEMTPRQKKAYDEIADRLITRLDDGSIVVARSNLSAQTRLLQFSSAYATVDSVTQDVQLSEPSPKLDALDELYEELGTFTREGRPVVVCAEHRQLIDLASARLTRRKIEHGLITGAQKEWERDVALRRFQAGETRVLLFTLKAGGVGLTMTAADTIIFLQRSWSMIDNKQAEDRVHRIGSEIHESVNVIDIITTGTVEETQLGRLAEKMMRLEEINRDRIALSLAGRDTTELDALEERILAANLGER